MKPWANYISYLRLSAFICGCILCAAATFAEPVEPRFRAQTIDDAIEIGYGVAAADVDGDGRVDILVADKRQFVWYRNPTWEKFVLAENLTERDNVCIAAADLDGDGKCEIAVGGDWAPNDRENSGAVFYLVPPEDRTHKWEAVKLHAEPTVHRMRWMELRGGEVGLVVAPLHPSARNGATGSRLLLYHFPDDVRGEWKISTLDDTLTATHNFDVVRPGEILLAGRERVLRIEHGRWSTDHTNPFPEFRGGGEVRSLRLSGGPVEPLFFATIEPMHGNQVVIYTAAGRSVLIDRLVEGHALACADLLGLGSDQIVAGWRGGGGGIVMFTPLDNNGEQWRETIIDAGKMACEDLCLADLDGDGDLDIIASGRATRNVVIYWNERVHE
jgi:hypothetical protein